MKSSKLSDIKENQAMIIYVVTGVFFYLLGSHEVRWDDDLHIFHNKLILEFDFQKAWTLIKQPYFGMYIPVSYLTWGAYYKIVSQVLADSYLVDSFYALNCCLHVLNSILILKILKLKSVPFKTSFWIGLIFLTHPMQLESVLWISEGRGMLGWTFGLTAWILILKNQRLFFLAIFFMSLALLSKPSFIILPTFFLVMEWDHLKSKKWFLLIIQSGFLPAILITQSVQELPQYQLNIDFSTRIIYSLDSLGWYFTHFVFPKFDSVLYNRNHIFLESTTVVDTIPYLIICGLTLYYFIVKRKNREIFGVLLILTPVLGLIPFMFQLYSNVADRYFYAAIFPLLYIIQKLELNHRWFPIFGIFLFIMTLFKAEYYESENVFWTQAMKSGRPSKGAIKNAIYANLKSNDQQLLVISELGMDLYPEVNFFCKSQLHALQNLNLYNRGYELAKQCAEKFPDRKELFHEFEIIFLLKSGEHDAALIMYWDLSTRTNNTKTIVNAMLAFLETRGSVQKFIDEFDDNSIKRIAILIEKRTKGQLSTDEDEELMSFVGQSYTTLQGIYEKN